MTRGVRVLVGLIHPRVAVVLHDLTMVWLAWFVVTWLRWSVVPEAAPVPLFSAETLIVIVCQALVFWWTGLYRGLWRFASLPDLANIARASALGALLVALALFTYDRLELTPRATVLAYPFALATLLSVPRWLYRYWKDSRLALTSSVPARRLLIIGAGLAGEALVRDLRRDPSLLPVGFLDDDRSLRGAKVHGVPVLAPIAELPRIADEVAAEMLLIAMPQASNTEMQRVVELCEATELPFRTVPRLQDVVEGKLQFNQLKEVAIEDLLGREPVILDWTAIRLKLSGRRVLVSGGGGSIGAELARQVARLGPAELIILELSEFNLYQAELLLRKEFPDLPLVAWLGDCTDASTVDTLFARHRPELVFHAAAFKHVPLLEGQVREAVRNNVFGTRTLASAAIAHRAQSFVLISTDKAVNPGNVMGATKRLAERYCQGANLQSATRFITVRFGNVLDSAGSVVPLFRRQIFEGGPVTVTHPEVSRYFMTIPEACQLILQAAVLGRGGETYLLDMGQPVQIRYLAEQMIRLARKQPGRDIQIVYTGLRPGEKLFEELSFDHEQFVATDHPKIYQAPAIEVDFRQLNQDLDRLYGAVLAFDSEAVSRGLRALVPELSRLETDNVTPLFPRRNLS